MKFFDQLAEFFLMPVDSIIEWMDEASASIGEFFAALASKTALSVAELTIECVSVMVVGYIVYCSFRVIASRSDEVFSEYTNKYMMAGIGYFFAKCGGRILLHSLIGG